MRSATLGNTVELSTGDLRSGTAFDTLKATFAQKLKIGSMKESELSAEYDYRANKDFLKEASLTGSLAEGDINVDYEVTHDFVAKNTNTKLTASKTVEGIKFGAEVSGGSLEEVSAEKDLDAGDNTINVVPSWLVQAKTARVKLMSKLGDDDTLSAQVDYKPDGGDTSYEVTLDHNLEAGRDLSATVDGDTVEVEYTDTKSEAGATWTASASVPTNAGGNLLDAAKVSVKRSWTW